MIKQLLDKAEQSIVICQCLVDQLLICETLTKHDILLSLVQYLLTVYFFVPF